MLQKKSIHKTSSKFKGLEDDGKYSDNDEEDLEAKEKTTKKNSIKGKSKKKFDFKAGGPDADMETDDDDDVFAALQPELEESFGFLRA